jgi:tRNA(Ile)-lysidine synthetase-like protein
MRERKRISGRSPRPKSPNLTSVSRHPLTGHVGRVLFQTHAIGDGAVLIVGLSGGSDSVALVLMLAALRKRRSSPRFDLTAIHVHHHLRPEADDDLTFAESLCSRLNIPLDVRHVQAGKGKGNLSDRARRLREAAFIEAAKFAGAAWVLTAHHADDQAETVLMNLARGAGFVGLAGMPDERELSTGVRLLRPVSTSTKRELEGVCRVAGQPWREDPTNQRTDRARTMIRHEILPRLEARWPACTQRIAKLAQHAAGMQDLLELLAREWMGRPPWPRPALRVLPTVVVEAGLRQAVLQAAPEAADDVSHEQIELAVAALRGSEARPRQFIWAAGLTLHVTARQVDLQKQAALGPGARRSGYTEGPSRKRTSLRKDR